MDPKQRSAHAALAEIRDGMTLGLGTGTTADAFLVALAAELRSGRLRGVRGVGTSSRTEHRAAELGIPLLDLAEAEQIDVTVDGADEIAPNLDLIKGLGGALLREKIVAQRSGRLVIIADESKLVGRLGEKGPVPVEVIEFGHQLHARFLGGLGCQPTLRLGNDGRPWRTDNGNFIYDCRFGPIDDPRELESRVRTHAGIVETGLFLGMAQAAYVAGADGARRLTR